MDISMCDQDCELKHKCKRHKASGTQPSDPQWYYEFTPPKDNPKKCEGWRPINEVCNKQP